MKNFDDLNFVQITSVEMFRILPRELFDQMTDKFYDIDLFFLLLPQYLFNPCNFMYALLDDEGKPKGFLWFIANVLNKTITVATLTIDKEYQGSNAIKKTADFIKSVDKEAKIVIMTNRPKAFERAGFRKSKNIRMEI